MLDITNRTTGASFTYRDEARHYVTGSYVVDSNKQLKTFNTSLYLNEADKGNSYLENGELKFSFRNVLASEIPGLVKAVEECKAEIEEQL